MVLTETAALAWSGAGFCPDVPRRSAALSLDSRGALAWTQRDARSLRARCAVAELVLLHRLRAGAPASLSEAAVRVIALTANAWLGAGSAGKP